eukprot:8307777-Pyramimonas_sp.AAC.2
MQIHRAQAFVGNSMHTLQLEPLRVRIVADNIPKRVESQRDLRHLVDDLQDQNQEELQNDQIQEQIEQIINSKRAPKKERWPSADPAWVPQRNSKWDRITRIVMNDTENMLDNTG